MKPWTKSADAELRFLQRLDRTIVQTSRSGNKCVRLTSLIEPGSDEDAQLFTRTLFREAVCSKYDH